MAKILQPFLPLNRSRVATDSLLCRTSNVNALSPLQLAKQLGIGPDKVYRWIDSGELRAINVAENKHGRPQWRIEHDELERFKAARSNEPARPTRERRPRRDDDYIRFF